jgi:hypothetical protein
MLKFISVSANHKNIGLIVEKAQKLGLTVTDEVSWDDGFKYSDKSRRNIKVIEHSDAMWNYLLQVEPTVDLSQKSKQPQSNHLVEVTAEDVLTFGY